MIDLTKILKEGDEVYCLITGTYEKISRINKTLRLNPIYILYNGVEYTFTKYGQLINIPNGECLIFPSKDVRTWNTTFKSGDVVLVWDNIGAIKHPTIFYDKKENKYQTIVVNSYNRLEILEWDNCELLSQKEYEKLCGLIMEKDKSILTVTDEERRQNNMG